MSNSGLHTHHENTCICTHTLAHQFKKEVTWPEGFFFMDGTRWTFKSDLTWECPSLLSVGIKHHD